MSSADKHRTATAQATAQVIPDRMAVGGSVTRDKPAAMQRLKLLQVTFAYRDSTPFRDDERTAGGNYSWYRVRAIEGNPQWVGFEVTVTRARSQSFETAVRRFCRSGRKSLWRNLNDWRAREVKVLHLVLSEDSDLLW
jgi:hypothetical protein